MSGQTLVDNVAINDPLKRVPPQPSAVHFNFVTVPHTAGQLINRVVIGPTKDAVRRFHDLHPMETPFSASGSSEQGFGSVVLVDDQASPTRTIDNQFLMMSKRHEDQGLTVAEEVTFADRVDEFGPKLESEFLRRDAEARAEGAAGERRAGSSRAEFSAAEAVRPNPFHTFIGSTLSDDRFSIEFCGTDEKVGVARFSYEMPSGANPRGRIAQIVFGPTWDAVEKGSRALDLPPFIPGSCMHSANVVFHEVDEDGRTIATKENLFALVDRFHLDGDGRFVVETMFLAKEDFQGELARRKDNRINPAG